MDLSLGQQNSRPRPRQEETAKGKNELDVNVSGEAARATHQTKFYPPIPPFQSLLPATSQNLSTATTILTSDTPASQMRSSLSSTCSVVSTAGHTTHFRRGSLIQLAGGQTKQVQEV